MRLFPSHYLRILLLLLIALGHPLGDHVFGGTWTELPNTKIQDVGPPNSPPPSGRLGSVIGAWSGAAMDTINNRLFIWGGGHNDYAGNEIYVLDLTAKTMERFWGPSPNSDDHWKKRCPDPKDSKLSDGTPMSRHTYGGLAYLEHVNLFWIYGGSRACANGGLSRDTWTFDPSTAQWKNEFPKGKIPGNGITITAYDPETKKVFMQRQRGFFAYEYGDSKTSRVNEWTKLNDKAIGGYQQMSGTIDPVRRKFVLVGGYKKRGTWLIDLDDSSPSPERLKTTNGAVIEGTQAPGIAYDPGSDRILAWDGSRRSKNSSSVWSLNVDSGQWTEIETEGSGMSVSGSTGTFGRWRYVPALKQFIAVISTKENAWLFSTSSAEGKTVSNISPPPPSGGKKPVSNDPTSPSPGSGYLDIPINTWIARPMSGDRTKAPSGGKHQRLAHNPDDGLIYFQGGDHGGTPGHSYQSSRNEMYTYNILTDTWTLIQPYCRTDGGPQPAGSDEHGWSWDSRRKVFWLVPGYSRDLSKGKCTQSTLISPNTVMNYSPTKGVWTHENRRTMKNFKLSSPGRHKFSQYDSVNDEIIMMGQDMVLIYSIEDDSWTKQKIRGGKTLRLGKEYSAMDPVERVIYAIDRANPRLARYDIEDESIDFLATPPSTVYQQSQVYWDPVNKVLLWFDHNQRKLGVHSPGRLHVYHPDTDTWEVDKQVDHSLVPEGVTVRGNTGVFDPYQNVLMVFGGLEPSNKYMFLYRYGEGSGQPPAFIPPSAPTDLHIMQ